MFELCYDCDKQLQKFYKFQSFIQRNLHLETEWVKHLAQTDFATSKHADEKLNALNLTVEDVSDISMSLSIIEIQTGFLEGDYKFIYRANNSIHVIFLYSKGKMPVLINIYNPLEGKNFKWNADGTQRIYLESFGKCCPHPDMKKFVDRKGYYVSKDYKHKQNQLRLENGKEPLDIPEPVKLI